MRINRQDTNGVKPLLQVGELGYDNYPGGGDAGRVYVGNGSENIPQAKKSEVVTVDGKIDTHIGRVDNPHTVTKTQVGLGSVDNTADSAKNVLSAIKLTTARAINGVNFDGTTAITVTANTAQSEVIKFDTGTTEGTDLYTFNGSSAKTINIKAGTNVTLTKAAGSVTINANDTSIAVTEITGMGAGASTFLSAPTSINLAAMLTDETGTGANVFANSPTLVTPALGVATGTSFNSITGLSSTFPVVDGVATIGTSTTVARADHVHPEDTTKVTKVASTDNAIVRFDGNTGAVQNSGVVIDDNGNVGVGTSSPDCSLEVVGNDIAVKISNNNTGPTTTALQLGGYSGVSSGIYGATLRSIHNFGITSASSLAFELAGLEKMRIDSDGNVGIGTIPSAWDLNKQSITLRGQGSAITGGIVSPGGDTNDTTIFNNCYYNSGWKYEYTGSYLSTKYECGSGTHKWYTAPSGTAGNAITWTNVMTLDASGNLLVGAPSGATHTIQKATVEDGAILYLHGGNAEYSAVFNRADGIGHNGASTALRIQKNSTTGRSINTAGTINTSGADYAEYEYSNDITITKGQIVGFKVDGTLTDKYNESIRFAIKSTNPSIVGGDTWGIEDIVGKRPEQPVRKVDKTEQVKIEDSEEFETVVIEAGDTDTEWEAIEAKYKAELADFEARLEAERQKVDRIAYAGKVPVNVYGATAGQYIVAIEKDSGIDGLAVNKADMTFAQYQDAIGRVNKILDDGRAEVAVIIH